jgi:hypothetical protein
LSQRIQPQFSHLEKLSVTLWHDSQMLLSLAFIPSSWSHMFLKFPFQDLFGDVRGQFRAPI